MIDYDFHRLGYQEQVYEQTMYQQKVFEQITPNLTVANELNKLISKFPFLDDSDFIAKHGTYRLIKPVNHLSIDEIQSIVMDSYALLSKVNKGIAKNINFSGISRHSNKSMSINMRITTEGIWDKYKTNQHKFEKEIDALFKDKFKKEDFQIDKISFKNGSLIISIIFGICTVATYLLNLLTAILNSSTALYQFLSTYGYIHAGTVSTTGAVSSSTAGTGVFSGLHTLMALHPVAFMMGAAVIVAGITAYLFSKKNKNK